MKVAVMLFTMLAAGVCSQQVFLQTEGEPMEVVENVKEVPVVGGQFKTKGVTTAMKCVISLTIQFMIVYTALAICRMAADGFGMKYENVPIQNILTTAAV